jgi:surfeit locus 1 family protein
MTDGKRLIIPALVTLAAFTLMMSLGVWQLHRLAWKEKMIAQSTAARAMKPLPSLPQEYAADELIFRSIRLHGKFLNDHEFHLAPRYHEGQFGYHILTPLQLSDGRVILVDRGWIPPEKKDPKTRPETLPRGVVIVRGILRQPLSPLWFMKSKPDDNLWFGQDMQAFSAATGKTLEPLIVESVSKETPGLLPIPSDGNITFRNDHLGYAITWFAIAAGVLIIFIIYCRRP